MSIKKKEDVVIIDAVRTPAGRFQGSLSEFSAPELGGFVIRAILERNRISGSDVDEVIFGNVLSGGVGQGPARQAAVKGGVPPNVPSFTINKVCGSALKAVVLASQSIVSGECKVVIAGGMESMSNAPFFVSGSVRRGAKFGDMKLSDSMINDGLWCAFENKHMGVLAEYTAEKSGISREEQDEFASESHRKAVRATVEGFFSDEIIPIKLKDGSILDKDETPRQDTSRERLSKLKPAFKDGGTVTAGNSSSLNDGASCVLIMSREEAEIRGVKPLAKILSWAPAATEPKDLFYAPIFSIRKLLERVRLNIEDIDAFEINEAFASQVIANVKELKIDRSKLNVNGGAIALGHPIGASGARILTTLVHVMKKRNAKFGVASLCIGGGMGISMCIEREGD